MDYEIAVNKTVNAEILIMKMEIIELISVDRLID